MKSTLSTLIVLMLSGSTLLAAQDTPVPGAKEIFFNSADGSVVSASQPNSFKAPPAGPSTKSKSKISSLKPKKKDPVPPPQVAQQAPKPDNPSSPQVVQAVDRTSTIGLSYWIELVGPNGRGQKVTANRIFRSGEKIRLHFRSNADGNIALIQLASSGTSSVLFPDPAKGFSDSQIAAGEDRIFPAESAWFRFDNTPGTEKILALFARSQQEIDTFSIKPRMDVPATKVMMASVNEIRGGKDLILETETEKVSEIGTYGVNLAGKPVVMEIELRHQ